MTNRLSYYDIFRALGSVTLDSRSSKLDAIFIKPDEGDNTRKENFGTLAMGRRHPMSLKIAHRIPLPCPECGRDLENFRFISAPAGFTGKLRRGFRNNDTGAPEYRMETDEERQLRVVRPSMPELGHTFAAMGECTKYPGSGRDHQSHRVILIGSLESVTSAESNAIAESIVIHSMHPSFSLLEIPKRNSVPPIIQEFGKQAGAFFFASPDAAANRLRSATEIFIDILRAHKEMMQRRQMRDNTVATRDQLKETIADHSQLIDGLRSDVRNAITRSAVTKTDQRLSLALAEKESLDNLLERSKLEMREASAVFNNARSNWLSLCHKGTPFVRFGNDNRNEISPAKSFEPLAPKIHSAAREGLFLVPGTKEALLALKAICNEGSHAGVSLESENVLDAAEVLSEIFMSHFTEHLQRRLYTFAGTNQIPVPRTMRG